jgi:hypothetical protein
MNGSHNKKEKKIKTPSEEGVPRFCRANTTKSSFRYMKEDNSMM